MSPNEEKKQEEEKAEEQDAITKKLATGVKTTQGLRPTVAPGAGPNFKDQVREGSQQGLTSIASIPDDVAASAAGTLRQEQSLAQSAPGAVRSRSPVPRSGPSSKYQLVESLRQSSETTQTRRAALLNISTEEDNMNVDIEQPPSPQIDYEDQARDVAALHAGALSIISSDSQESTKNEVVASQPYYNHVEIADETMTTEKLDEECGIIEEVSRAHPELVEAELVEAELVVHERRMPKKNRSLKSNGSRNRMSIYQAEAFEDAVILDRRRMLIFAAAVLATIGIILGGVCGSGKCKAKSSTVTVTMSVDTSKCTKTAPLVEFDTTTMRFQEMIGLFSFLYDTAPFQDEDNPRFRALHWIANEDPMQVDIHANEIDRLQQRYSLAVFYFSTQGWCWELNTNWLSGNSECLWETVSCSDGNSYVDIISAPRNNIEGTLPSELSSLVKMTNLDLGR